MLDKHKMAKHFVLDITDTSFGFSRKIEQITEEAALDGIYVVRTSCPPPHSTTPAQCAATNP